MSINECSLFFHRFLKAFPLLLRQIEGLKMLQEKQENDVRNKINPNKPIAKIKSMPAKTKKSDMLDDDDSDNELQVIYFQKIFIFIIKVKIFAWNLDLRKIKTCKFTNKIFFLLLFLLDLLHKSFFNQSKFCLI